MARAKTQKPTLAAPAAAPPATPALRLIISQNATSPGRFSAAMEGGSVIVASSRQPLADGARALLAAGHDPTMLVTLRHQNSTTDSFVPLPISKWATATYKESESDPLRRVLWVSFPDGRVSQKQGSEPPEVSAPQQ